MSNINAFVETLKEFLREMKKTFPEQESIQEKLDVISDLNEKGLNRMFKKLVNDLKSVSDDITSKDDKCFKKGNCKFFDDLNMEKLWKLEVDDNTRSAIWQYINTLFILGTTIQAIPPEMMSSIEKMAQECASNMAQNATDDDNQEIDIDALMAGMKNIMGNMNFPPIKD